MSNDNDFRKQAVKIIEQCVCKERNEAYGSVEENFNNIAELWMWWLRKRGIVTDKDASMTELDVAQMISFIKIARKLNDVTYLDNWIDDAGYNACGASVLLKDKGYLPPLGPGMKGTTRAQREQEHATESREDSQTA
jgi:hypothetical protein